MVYGFIVCAGNQARFKSSTPKALVDIKGKTLLQRNIELMSPFCDKVFVVCSILNHTHFTEENVVAPAEKLVIESGKGSGDAVWQILEDLNIKEGDTCFVLWGDSLEKTFVYEKLKNAYKGTTLLPCTFVNKPDPQIIPNEDGTLSVHFSDFKDSLSKGYHSISLFYCNAYDLKFRLRDFHNAIMDENENYVHKHDNEMVFLDIFNESDLKGEIVDIGEYNEFFFKTVEQLEEKLKTLTEQDLQ